MTSTRAKLIYSFANPISVSKKSLLQVFSIYGPCYINLSKKQIEIVYEKEQDAKTAMESIPTPLLIDTVVFPKPKIKAPSAINITFYDWQRVYGDTFQADLEHRIRTFHVAMEWQQGNVLRISGHKIQVNSCKTMLMEWRNKLSKVHVATTTPQLQQFCTEHKYALVQLADNGYMIVGPNAKQQAKEHNLF